MSRFRSCDYRPVWTHDEKMALIEMAEKFQVLWDTSYPFFRELTQRKHALEEIYNVLDGRHTVEDINAQWRNLKDVFHKKKAAVEQMAGPGETPPDPSWRYYAPLKFLLSCEEERKNNLRKRFEGRFSSYEIAQLRQMRFRRQTEIAARRKQREDEAMERLVDLHNEHDQGSGVANEPPAKRFVEAAADWSPATSRLVHPRPLHTQRIPRRPPGSALTGNCGGGESTSKTGINAKLKEEDVHVGGRHPINLDAWARPKRRGQPPPIVMSKAFFGSAAGPTRPAIISSGAAIPPAPAVQPSTSSTAAAFPSAVAVKTEAIDDDGEPAESPPAIDREEEPTEAMEQYADLNDPDEEGKEDSDAIECLRPARPSIVRSWSSHSTRSALGQNGHPMNAAAAAAIRAMNDDQPEDADLNDESLQRRRGSPWLVGERLVRWQEQQQAGTSGATAVGKPLANGSATVNVRSSGGIDLKALTSADPASSSTAGANKFKYFAQYVESALLDINQQSPTLARRLVQNVYASVAEYQAMLL